MRTEIGFHWLQCVNQNRLLLTISLLASTNKSERQSECKKYVLTVPIFIKIDEHLITDPKYETTKAVSLSSVHLVFDSTATYVAIF